MRVMEPPHPHAEIEFLQAPPERFRAWCAIGLAPQMAAQFGQPANDMGQRRNDGRWIGPAELHRAQGFPFHFREEGRARRIGRIPAQPGEVGNAPGR